MKKETLLFCLFLFVINIQIKSDWVQVNNGLNIWTVNALCSYTSNGVNYLFAGTLRGGPNSGVVFVSTNDGNSWSISSYWPSAVWSLATTSNGSVKYVFAGTEGGIGITTNNGVNWYFGGGPSYPLWTVSLSTSGNYVFASTFNYADTGGVYKSTNYGLNWTRITYFPPVPVGYEYYVGVNANNVYACGFYTGGIYVSTDFGTTWVQSSGSPGAKCFAFGTNYIYSGFINSFGPAVYRSINNGFTWTPTSLDSVGVNALLVYNNFVFAGGGGAGVAISSDNGASWILKNEGLGGLPNSLCISNSFLFTGTSGHGVYRRPLSEITNIKPISEKIPQYYKLGINFPNPFNSSTNIKVEISKKGLAKLIVCDLTGRIVSTLINDNLQPGNYEVNWNADNFSSGVYFYTLTVNDFIDTKKAILLK